MPKQKQHFLSVVIPAYKQEKTIIEDIDHIKKVLDNLNYHYEIIIVVDGKIDKTYDNAKKAASSRVKVVGYDSNRGKGYAVRYGMVRTKGDLIAFIDSGMDLNPEGIPLLIEHMLWYNSDVIVGSIRHSASKVTGYPLKRKIYSWGYHLLTKILFGLRITDSQRGLKVFRRCVLEKVLPRLLVKRYAFDIEILSVAYHLGYTRIHDGPVELDATKYALSSIKSSTIIDMLKDTLAVFYRLKILHYYDTSSQRHWQFDPELNFRVNLG